MPDLFDAFLQSGADFVNGLPDWCFIVLTIILVIGIPIMFSWALGGEDDV